MSIDRSQLYQVMAAAAAAGGHKAGERNLIRAPPPRGLATLLGAKSSEARRKSFKGRAAASPRLPFSLLFSCPDGRGACGVGARELPEIGRAHV